jgi:hypothetical protein
MGKPDPMGKKHSIKWDQALNFCSGGHEKAWYDISGV